MTNALFGGIGLSSKPKTSLLDRAVNNLSDIATGFVPGMLEIGHSVGNDMLASLPGTANNFKTPALGKSMGKAMWSNSALPPLLLGNPGEALRRANARPIDALLDFSLAAPATTGAARLGMHAAPLRPMAAPLLGLNKLNADSTAALLDIPLEGSIYNKLARPSTLTFEGGNVVPTREFGQIENYGGDLYARQDRRTLNPLKRPDLVNPTDTPEKIQELLDADSNITEFAKKYPTLGDDPNLNYMTYRAKSEPFAAVGDAVHELTSMIPDNRRFSHAQRIGRKMTQAEGSASFHEIDVEEGRFQETLGNTMRALKELYPDRTPEQYEQMLKNTQDARAFVANKETIPQLADAFDPAGRLGALDLETARQMSVREVYDKYGVYLHNKKNYKTLNPLDEQQGAINFGQALDDYDAQIRSVDSTLPKGTDGYYNSDFEMRAISPNHAKAREGVKFQRDEFETAVALEMKNLEALGVQPVLRSRTPDGDDLIVTPEEIFGGARIDDMLNRGDWDVDFIARDGAPKTPEEIQMAIENGGASKSKEAIRYQLQQLGQRIAHKTDYDNNSNYLLNQYSMKDGLKPRAEAMKPGVVDRLRKIGENMIDEEHWEHPALKEYWDHQDELNNRSADFERETGMLGSTLFNKEQQGKNEQRAASYARGNEMGMNLPEGVDGRYMEMAPGSREAQNKYEKGRDRPDAILDPYKNNKPGRPHDIWLKGAWSDSPRAVIDDFQKNRKYVAGSRVTEAMQKYGKRMTRAEGEALMAKSQGAIDDQGSVPDKSFVGPYVMVTHRGMLANDVEQSRSMLKDIVNRSNDPEIAGLARELDSKIRLMDFDPNEKIVEGQGHDRTAREVMEGAERTDDVFILPTEVWRAATNEMKASRKALSGILEAGTEMWKWSVLHARFLSWMKNNFVGAHTMVMMAGGPEHYFREMSRRGTPEYAAMRDLVHERMPDYFGSGSGALVKSHEGKNDGPIRKKVRPVVNKLGDFNVKYADDPAREIRLFSLIYEQMNEINKMRGLPEGDFDIDVVEKFMDDPVIRKELAQRAGTEMVDFTDMSEMEKRYIRSIFPFWAWMKGSSKASSRLVADHPERVWAAAQVSEVGSEGTEEDYGNFTPEFVGAWWNPGDDEGNILKTGGMNPYGSAFDWLGTGAMLVPNIPLPGTDDEIRTGMSYRAFGSENPLAGAHPVLGAGVEALTGRNIFFGTPIEQGSVGGGFVSKLLGGLPGSMYANRLLKNETGPDATTKYSRALDSANFLAGIPIAQPLPGNVRARGVDEMNERYQSPLAWRELQ